MLNRVFHNKTDGILKVFIIGLLLWSVCKADVVLSDTPQTPSDMGKMLILPFNNMAAVYGENKNTRCPICGKIFITGEVAEIADRMLTDHLFLLLKEREDIALVPTGQARGVWVGLLLESKRTLSERELLIKTGRALAVDTVMVGYLYRFQDRIGNQYSVDSPASVAFHIHLIRVSDGRLLWSGSFDETQRSLSENLFQLGTFIQRKARWITAKEMAISGLENIMKTLRPKIENE
jgi:hypothetical protein